MTYPSGYMTFTQHTTSHQCRCNVDATLYKWNVLTGMTLLQHRLPRKYIYDPYQPSLHPAM